MSEMPLRRTALRDRHGHEHARVTFLELFFDLVFVFAITQLSHGLIEHLSLAGAVQALLLLFAVWWVWIYTTWAMNWLNPDHTGVRVMLLVLMLAGLVMSTSLPQAFESRGTAFAGAYVTMQLSRCAFMLWALRRHNRGNFRNFQRITVWLAVASVFWLGGAFVEGNERLAAWGIALCIEVLSPVAYFWTPGLGRSTTADWNIDGAQFAERCGLFIIILLGESILVTGMTFSNLPWDAQTVVGFLTGFVGSATMWWIYFDIGAERANRHIIESSDPGRFARLAYTYGHLPIVAGIIVTAVADELVLVHPHGDTSIETAAVVVGGPALFLAGNVAFKRTTARHMPLSHLVGLGLLALLVPVTWFASPLALGGLATATLVIVAIWERHSLGATPVHAKPAAVQPD